MAHNITNTTLNVIHGLAGLLLGAENLRQVQRKYLNYIVDRAEKSEEMMDRLLSFNSRGQFNPTREDLDDYLDNVYRKHFPLLPEKMDLVMVRGKSRLPVAIDRNRFNMTLEKAWTKIRATGFSTPSSPQRNRERGSASICPSSRKKRHSVCGFRTDTSRPFFPEEFPSNSF